jgi:transcriptional regulator with XRE-family HTH domain
VVILSIGENIRKLRQENGFTQEELASRIFVTRNAVSKWETDKGIPSIDNLKQLASLFKVSLDQIVNEEDRLIMAMDNTAKINKIKDIYSTIGIFLTYSLNGFVIPYIFLKVDGFSDPAINYLLLPLLYVLIGLISILRNICWKYLLIGSLLAMLPIYVLYDIFLPDYSLGLIGLLHYVFFIFSYFLMKQLINKLNKRFKKASLSKFFRFSSLIITGIYLIHTTISSIVLYNCIICSAPWYLEVVVNTLLYAVPIALPTILYFYFRNDNS